MLIPGVYIKGNDLAGILNGKIKALLETPMMNGSALLVPYHDKVELTSAGHLPGNSSKAPGTSEGPREGAAWGDSRTCSRGHALASSSLDPGCLHCHCRHLYQESLPSPWCVDLNETAESEGSESRQRWASLTVQPDALCEAPGGREAGGGERRVLSSHTVQVGSRTGYSTAAQSWACHVTSSGLSFLVYRMGVTGTLL